MSGPVAGPGSQVARAPRPQDPCLRNHYVEQPPCRSARATRIAAWTTAAAISLLANAEFFLWLGHHPLEETGVSPIDTTAMLVELPAAEPDLAAPAPPGPLPEIPATSVQRVASQSPPEAEMPALQTERSEEPTPASETNPRLQSREPSPKPETHAEQIFSPASSSAMIQEQLAGDDPRQIEPPLPSKPRARTSPTASAAHAKKARRPGAAALVTGSHKTRGVVRGTPAALKAQARRTRPATMAAAVSIVDWKSQVVAAINRVKHYPDGTQAIGSPTVRLLVAASGDVASVGIVSSSGSERLDTTALAIVRRTSPLPPPPNGATHLTFRMNFALRSP